MNVMRTNPALADADPKSVLSSAMVAATLDLPIDGSLGFAAIVPYRNKGKALAQFQIMTKGFVQLALRSGQYKSLNVGPVYADEYHGINPITGDVDIRPVTNGLRDQFDESLAIGYVCYFRLMNGYECTRFWTVEEIKAHGKKYSKSYDNEYGLWRTNFPAMAAKTVLKNTLSKWGILSTLTMQMAIKTDQAAIVEVDGTPEADYVDAVEQEQIEAREPEEVVKIAAGSAPAEKATAPNLEGIIMALEEYLNSDISEQKKADIMEALAKYANDPVILGNVLNKVKAAKK
jgi:recombination protein RecT